MENRLNKVNTDINILKGKKQSEIIRAGFLEGKTKMVD